MGSSVKKFPSVIIAGGSGSLGLRLAAYFTSRGHHVTILTREARDHVPYRQLLWDGLTVDSSWGNLLPGSVLINLAGQLVDRVPTSENVRELKRSRVNPTAALVSASRQFGGPAIWLQMSTLAIYGDAGDTLLTEDTAVPADGPPQMAGVAKAWEGALGGAVAGRIVVMRTGVVLDRGYSCVEPSRNNDSQVHGRYSGDWETVCVVDSR
jgi:NAD dependent epimerase/dehydratase family enzyme